MIQTISIYFITYFLTYLGFILATEEVVKDELKELQKPIKYGLDILTLTIYIILLYIFKSNILIITTTILLLILKLVSLKHRKTLEQIHNVILFGTTLIYAIKYLPVSQMYIAIIPTLILFFQNTNIKFDKVVEVYKSLLALAVFIIFNII